jgi:hypothetical protein
MYACLSLRSTETLDALLLFDKVAYIYLDDCPLPEWRGFRPILTLREMGQSSTIHTSDIKVYSEYTPFVFICAGSPQHAIILKL